MSQPPAATTALGVTRPRQVRLWPPAPLCEQVRVAPPSPCALMAPRVAVTSYSSAPVGHTCTHSPQLVHLAGSIVTPRSMLTASCGQTCWHRSQPPTAMRSTKQRWPV